MMILDYIVAYFLGHTVYDFAFFLDAFTALRVIIQQL